LFNTLARDAEAAIAGTVRFSREWCCVHIPKEET